MVWCVCVLASYSASLLYVYSLNRNCGFFLQTTLILQFTLHPANFPPYPVKAPFYFDYYYILFHSFPLIKFAQLNSIPFANHILFFVRYLLLFFQISSEFICYFTIFSVNRVSYAMKYFLHFLSFLPSLFFSNLIHVDSHFP